LAKSLAITILLAVLVSGVGHIYLGIIKRGIIILIVGIAIWIIVP
jgi:TM2 domain-containing membrane protein YozV